MNLKNTLAAKILCNTWSPSRMTKFVDDAEIELSHALDYVMPNNIKVSCVQISLHAEMPMKDCLNIIINHVKHAVADGSQLIVFPEYIGLMPLLSSDILFDTAYQFSDDLIKRHSPECDEVLDFYSRHLAQPLLDSYTAFFSRLACLSSIYILAGTTIVKSRDGLVNRSYLFDPEGTLVLRQDKLHLSSQEHFCGLIPGKSLSVAQTKLGRIAVLTGKDQRVYEAGHAAYQQGAQLLLCPSAFSSSLGSAYFQTGVFMRCQEHPMFGISSWLTGEFMDLPFRSVSGIYAPFSVSKQGDGIVVQTEKPTSSACMTARIDIGNLMDDPDLYISDINIGIDQLLRKEYAVYHHRAAKNSQSSDTFENEPSYRLEDSLFPKSENKSKRV